MTIHHTNPPPLAAKAAMPKEFLIEPRKGWIGVDWAELWNGRELFYFLVLRDIKVRYKQSVLGVAWAALQPILTMLLFTVVFSQFAKIPSDGQPYAVFVFAGLLPWSFFSNAVNQASLSLVNQQALLTKVYLPRAYIPGCAIGSGVVDLLVAFSVFAGLMLLYDVAPGWGVLALPGLVLITVFAALGVGLALAALTVNYRDIRHVVPFLMQCWLYVSPVVYPLSAAPEKWRFWLAINPMTGLIDGYRSALLGTPWRLDALAISSTSAIAFLVFGLYYFRKVERRFADIA